MNHIVRLKPMHNCRRLLSATAVTRKADSLHGSSQIVSQSATPMEDRLAKLEQRLNEAIIELQELRERSLASQERMQRINMLKRPEYKPLQGLFDKSLPWPAPLIRRSEAAKNQNKVVKNKQSSAEDSISLKLSDNALNSSTNQDINISNNTTTHLRKLNDGKSENNQIDSEFTDEDELLIEMSKATNRAVLNKESNSALSEEDIEVLLRPKYVGDNKLDALLDNVLSKPTSSKRNSGASLHRQTDDDKDDKIPPRRNHNTKALSSGITSKLREKQHLVKRLHTRINQSQSNIASHSTLLDH
ncbi:hypothetical protein BDF19DRAFT_444473 [Syncephalis fuscata]|nr:hypothetical protein BDF19DRAFT_444473 [Syncephalis fuscata]